MSKPAHIANASATITIAYRLEGHTKPKRITIHMDIDSFETKVFDPNTVIMHPDAPMRESIMLTGYRRKAGK